MQWKWSTGDLVVVPCGLP